jgi:hypothetical protein
MDDDDDDDDGVDANDKETFHFNGTVNNSMKNWCSEGNLADFIQAHNNKSNNPDDIMLVSNLNDETDEMMLNFSNIGDRVFTQNKQQNENIKEIETEEELFNPLSNELLKTQKKNYKLVYSSTTPDNTINQNQINFHTDLDADIYAPHSRIDSLSSSALLRNEHHNNNNNINNRNQLGDSQYLESTTPNGGNNMDESIGNWSMKISNFKMKDNNNFNNNQRQQNNSNSNSTSSSQYYYQENNNNNNNNEDNSQVNSFFLILKLTKIYNDFLKTKKNLNENIKRRKLTIKVS